MWNCLLLLFYLQPLRNQRIFPYTHWPQFFIYLLMRLASYLRTHCHEDSPPCFKSFTELAFIVRPLIHLELFINEVNIQLHSSTYGNTVPLKSSTWKSILFFTKWISHPCQKSFLSTWRTNKHRLWITEIGMWWGQGLGEKFFMTELCIHFNHIKVLLIQKLKWIHSFKNSFGLKLQATEEDVHLKKDSFSDIKNSTKALVKKTTHWYKIWAQQADHSQR